MNDALELLREWDADAAPLSGPARDRARHQLLNAMAYADQRTGTGTSRRHALRLAAAAVVATAVTGTGVLIATDLVPGVKTIPGVKDSAGRTGVGIACTERGSYEGKYLIFDPASYEFLGFPNERTSASGKKKYIQLSHVVDWGSSTG
ncbi:hypothetical protein ACH4RA_18655 [Streptomyces smyrnaeus]|uniref:hypothetical protein n=1 Tax=Streptomyces TaxID=1883 RepID=UPI001B383737|nr:hypothetical protein [Streptomyces sp. B15]MBQ1122964.1 hypothetical protein [Streptomyces sp. B15]